MRAWRPTSTHATGIALLALFVALGGLSWAVVKAPRNSVVSKSIKNNNVRAVDVKDEGLTGADVAGNSITGADVEESSLDTVPSATSAVSASSATTAANAELLSNRPLPEFLRYGATIPSGTTVTGAWGGRANITKDVQYYRFGQAVSFPLPAPADLADAQVNFANSLLFTPADTDGTCGGAPDNPTAPAGKVCIYIEEASSVSYAVATAEGFSVGSDGASRYGFYIDGPEANGASSNTYNVSGTWAYTAP